jgi:hypothetical protein
MEGMLNELGVAVTAGIFRILHSKDAKKTSTHVLAWLRLVDRLFRQAVVALRRSVKAWQG